MNPSHAFRLFAIYFVAGAGLLCFLASSGPACSQPEHTSQRPLYDTDPEHLWNRLHEAIFGRVGPDGRTYGRDRLDPLLWVGSKHLLEEQSNKRAVALLEEFLKTKGEKRVEGPLKRAMLQRDLWLVFNWLEGEHANFYEPTLKPEEVRAARDRLRRLLAAVIRRLAIAPDQLEKLPDNYAAAVASGEFARQFDPLHPDKPYLPADLFAADGAWVCAGRSDGPVAPEHLRDTGTNVFTNSTFLLFLRLPAGRAATVDYLKRLRSFDQPPLVGAKDPGNGVKHLPSPKLPPLPVGTEVALVRRALLISASNKPTATALTESVQLRIYREVPEITSRAVSATMQYGTAGDRRARSWQSFQEYQLSRTRLFAGRAGGLRAVGPDELDLVTPFLGWYRDEFENADYRSGDRSFAEGSQNPIKHECFQCHGLPGTASFNSYFNFRGHLNDDDTTARPFALTATPVSEVSREAVKWKEARPNWIALRALLRE
jgi:hypothetical protein